MANVVVSSDNGNYIFFQPDYIHTESSEVADVNYLIIKKGDETHTFEIKDEDYNKLNILESMKNENIKIILIYDYEYSIEKEDYDNRKQIIVDTGSGAVKVTEPENVWLDKHGDYCNLVIEKENKTYEIAFRNKNGLAKTVSNFILRNRLGKIEIPKGKLEIVERRLK